MAQVQLYAQQQNNGQYVALDLHIEEPIKLNLSVANIIDPTATNSTFSRTFRVPHTAVNGPYFEGVFNVNSLNFDASKKADAYILDNGIFFENGNIRLNAINVNGKDNSVEYEITFYGATSDFGSKIGGGFMNEIDLTQYNHTKSWANISGSWSTTGGLFDGNVRYGLIEWGYTYNAQNQPDIPTLSTGFAKSFTNPANPYKKDQWKPQIRAKAIWDQIFLEAGYTYDSVFLDSEFFKNQYIISDNVASATLNNSNVFSAERQGIYNTTIGQPFPWITPIEISDPGNNFVASSTDSGVYTAPSTGNYDMEMKANEVEFYLYGGGQDIVIIGYEANVLDADTGISLSQYNDQWTFSSSNPGGQSLDANFNLYLQAGQRVRFQFRTFVIQGQVSLYGVNIQFYGQTVACTLAPEVLSVNGIMPSNIRKIDFMKSIINRYKLVFAPSKFQANHFTITPWKDWVLEGRSKDWTDRLDTSKDMVIKPLFFDQARFQIYKDQEDSDYLNYNYQLGIKQTFGQLNLDSTNELIKGTKEYKDQFSPTPLDGIGYISGSASEIEAANFLIPHMAKDTGGNGESVGNVSVGKREPIQPKLRLVFWNGMRSAPITWYAQTDGTAATMFDYPLMSQYSNFPVTSTTFDLNWENELPLYNYELIAGVLTNPKSQTSFSCFNTYWKSWYDVTFDPYSRLVEAHFALDYNEILDLKFNDYIFVKDAWYFVNSVSDYVAGETSNCRVQLIKLGNNIGITLPVVTPPAYTAFETCYSQDNLCTSHCCATYAGAQNVTIYTNGTTLIDSTLAYQDSTGGIIAAPGYYSNQSGTIFVNSNGAILVQDTSECNCVPVYYTFTVSVNTSGCEVCCNNGPTVVLYGANAVFEQNGIFFQDQLLTIPAPAGFYKQSGATFALQVVPNGTVVNNFLCSNCNCTIYYPFTVCQANNLCDACCCFGGTSTVYGENEVFEDNVILYLNNTGLQPVVNGFYKLNDTTVAQVTGGEGDVTAFAVCTTCTPCPVGPVEVTVNVSAEVAGYTTSTLLQKSYDNGINWVDIGTVTIEASEPANTQKSQLFTTELDVRVRAISSTNTINGFIQTNYYINLDQFENTTVATPTTRTVTIASPVTDEYTYEFNAIVTDGDPASQDIIYVVGKFNQYAGGVTPPLNQAGSFSKLDSVATQMNLNNFQPGYQGGAADGVTIVNGVAADTFGNIYTAAVQKTVGGDVSWDNVNIFKAISKFDADGVYNTQFATNLSATFNLGTNYTDFRVKVIDDKLYFFGKNSVWRLNLDGTVDNTWGSSVPGLYFTDPSTYGDTGILDIEEFGGLFYVTGYLPRTNGTLVLMIVLNSDGTFNSTETNKYNTLTSSPFCVGIRLAKDATYLYLAGNFTTWGGSTVNNIASFTPSSGVLNSTFHATSGGFTGGPAVAYDVVVNNNGIYVSTGATTFKGTAIHPIVRLNYDGSLNNQFITGSILNKDNAGTYAADLKLNNDGFLYAAGPFKTINNITTKGLAKLNGITGVLDTSFDVDGGFTYPDSLGGPNNSILVNDIHVISGSAPAPPTLYPITVAFSTRNACAAYCATPKTNVVYGNGPSLIQSTILYLNAEGTTFATMGWYSDGASIAQVGTNGVIIAFANPALCNCNTLYQFDVQYDAEICIACAVTGTPISTTVYGLNPNWSSNTVLYSDLAGTTFANQGYYVYGNGIVLYVTNNGFVQSGSDCIQACGFSENCVAYRITNNTASPVNYTYYTCLQDIVFGTLFAFEQHNTGCVIENTVSVPQGVSVVQTAIC